MAKHEDVAPELKFEGVSKAFAASKGLWGGTATLLAVDNVGFELRKGESLGLVGESGCGKSTLGRLACGLLAPGAGSISLEGAPLPLAGAKSWAAGKVQMIFQDPASSLNPRMKIRAAVAEPLACRGVSARDSLARADSLLAAVGLQGLGDRYPHQFSGGQRQRVAVARALITSPSVIVCDEPVSALDASVQAQILNLLRDMRERFRPAYLFISHDLAVIGFMCSRVLVMYLGQIVEEAGRDDLFAHAAHPYSRALLAAMPQGGPAWNRDADALPPLLRGELPSPLNPPAGCRFHPRCPEARDICARVAPPWQSLAPDWRVRCHFAGR